MTASGIFLTHLDTPRIRGHFERLTAESAGLVDWEWVISHDSYPRPETSLDYEDPADVLPVRYRRMAEHGGVQGGYLDTLLVPLLRALPGEYRWLCEYDVDFAGRWEDVFRRFVDSDADLLTSTVLFRREQPRWNHWEWAAAPPGITRRRWLRSFNPLMRVGQRMLEVYCAAMADDAWQGHYEFTMATAAHAAGLVVEDLGGDTSFTPDGRCNALYLGRSPAGRPKDLTFGFRPVRTSYYEERPDTFERDGLLYHPVKPGVRAWNRETRNASRSWLDAPGDDVGG